MKNIVDPVKIAFPSVCKLFFVFHADIADSRCLFCDNLCLRTEVPAFADAASHRQASAHRCGIWEKISIFLADIADNK
jgi:hypothetical protein